MPYKCVHCSQGYEDGSQELLSGCSKCGKKFFFYIKKEQAEKIRSEDVEESISSVEKKQMEKDVREIAGLENEEDPVFLDFESVRVVRPGKYLVDLGKLFERNKPRIYQLEDGKYIIDLASSEKSI